MNEWLSDCLEDTVCLSVCRLVRGEGGAVQGRPVGSMAVVALPLPAPSFVAQLCSLTVSLAAHSSVFVASLWMYGMATTVFSHADGQAAPSTHPSPPASTHWYHSITCQVLVSLSPCLSVCLHVAVVAVCASICLDVADALAALHVRAIHHAIRHATLLTYATHPLVDISQCTAAITHTHTHTTRVVTNTLRERCSLDVVRCGAVPLWAQIEDTHREQGKRREEERTGEVR